MRLFTNLENFDRAYLHYFVNEEDNNYRLVYSNDLYELSNIPILFRYEGLKTLEKLAEIEHFILDEFHKITNNDPFYEIIKFLVSFKDWQEAHRYLLTINHVKKEENRCFLSFEFEEQK